MSDQPTSTAPLAAGLPLVQGRCPACGTSGLFLGDGGYITCSLIDCPQPDAATEVIADFWKARQHGAFTFCEQNVGHVTMTEFAKKITEKVTAVGQRKEAVAYANEQKQRAERAEVALRAIDADKLDLLADWFDTDDATKGPGRSVDVQADLRRWARTIRAAVPANNGEERPRTTPDNSPTSSDTTDNPALRDQFQAAIESEMYEFRERTMWWPETGGVTQEIARLATRGAMEIHDRELEQLRAKVAEFDHIINWHTTCASCARILDSAYAETVRAETAEQQRDRLAEALREVLDQTPTASVSKTDLERWRAVLDENQEQSGA